MLFTWNTENLCIVFSSWRITGTWSLIWSLIAVMALTAGYEAVREASRRYEARQPTSLTNTNSKSLPPCFFRMAISVAWAWRRSRCLHARRESKMQRQNAAHCFGQKIRRREGRGVARLSRRLFMACRSFIRFSSCEYPSAPGPSLCDFTNLCLGFCS